MGMTRLLVTGGAGFIGSHTCLVLLEAGYDLLILDNFSNSSPEALSRVATLANVVLNSRRLQVEQGDIRNPKTLDQLFSDAAASNQPVDAVIHFAGLKAVGESVQKPLLYWDVNVSGLRNLLAAMDAHACRTLVSAAAPPSMGFPTQSPSLNRHQSNPSTLMAFPKPLLNRCSPI